MRGASHCSVLAVGLPIQRDDFSTSINLLSPPVYARALTRDPRARGGTVTIFSLDCAIRRTTRPVVLAPERRHHCKRSQSEHSYCAKCEQLVPALSLGASSQWTNCIASPIATFG